MPGSRLCLAAREEIRAGLERGDSIRQIARLLDRSASTISREIRRNRSRRGYVAHVAHRRAGERARRPKPLKLLADSVLRERVQAKLGDRLSPRVISLQLRAEGLSVSAETIYRACYHPDAPLGEDAHRLLCRPRRGRQRRRRTRTGRDPQPLGLIRSVRDRAAYLPHDAGHWEGDLLVGQQNRSAVVVLTERHSRLVQLIALPDGRRTDHVTSRIAHTLTGVPAPLRQSLTWDQGMEMARWQHTQDTTGIDIYFCHPHSPWERPSNENVNRLVRYWLPKGTDLYRHSQHDLDQVAQIINTTPRRIHQWRTAQDVYDDHTVALTM